MSTAKPRRVSPTNDQDTLDAILTKMSEVGFTLGEFLYRLFGEFTKDELKLPQGATFSKRSRSHAKVVSFFLPSKPNDPKHSVRSIVSAIYEHSDSVPTQHRATAEHVALPNKDATLDLMARHQLTLWAIDTVIKSIDSEANVLANKTSQLRLPADQQNWQAGLLALLGEPPRNRSPFSVATPAILMLIGPWNILCANYFQKVIGAWLFSCHSLRPSMAADSVSTFNATADTCILSKLLTFLRHLKRRDDNSPGQTSASFIHSDSFNQRVLPAE
ncbi:hypothetical protein RSAG8_09789, partial [Rhizoctonia solani AG-8 WAC10335]